MPPPPRIILDTNAWIRVTPKKRPFLRQNIFGFDLKFSIWIDILGLYIIFFPPEFFWFKVTLDFQAPSRQSGMKMLEPKPLQIAS